MTNENAINIVDGSPTALMGPFCIEADTVLDLDFTATFDNEVTAVMVQLLLDGFVVAMSQVNDKSAPSNLHLRYRGRITDETQAMVIVNT